MLNFNNDIESDLLDTHLYGTIFLFLEQIAPS